MSPGEGERPSRAALAGALLLAVAVRAPFWREALKVAPDGDTSIVGLMARHPGVGVTLWGQPYGSPLDAWIAAPFVAALGPTVLALRLPYFLLGLTLVPLAFVLGSRLDPRAAGPAAFLAACPPAYLVLLSALPPPFYPTLILLTGLLLLLAIDASRQMDAGGSARGRLAAWGLLAGLALWTHLLSAPAVLASFLWLLWRARRRLAHLLLPLALLVLAAAPWWLRLRDPLSPASVGLGEGVIASITHAANLAPDLERPLGTLLGVDAPLTADDPDQRVQAPAPVRAALALLYAGSALLALVTLRRRGEAWLLAGVAALLVFVFPFSLRSGPEAARFLSPAWLPLALLVALGLASRPRGTLALAALLALLHVPATVRLLQAWRGPLKEPLVPECAPILALLDERGLTRAYASYNTAYCLTYLSGERVIASQPWNERFYGYPLPYLDEVRYASRVAWVLLPGPDFELPSPKHFEGKLADIGGRWRRTDRGRAVVYDDFAPPFPPRVAALPGAGPAGDRDPLTRVSQPASSPQTWTLPAPQPLAALTLLAGGAPPRLPASFNLEVSADGRSFERVLRRRAERAWLDLLWVNGHPQAVTQDDVATVALGGRPVAAIRLTPMNLQPWSIGEVLLHPAAAEEAWEEGPAGTWHERRTALAAAPQRDRAGWHLRTLLAAAHD